MGEAFRIPQIEEVVIHIQAKKPEWPKEFIEYYASRFWNFYQSNGWKVSGRAAMKDWKAAFASQWQRLKYQDDIDTLQKMTPKKVSPLVALGLNKDLSHLNQVFAEYCKHPTIVPEEILGSLYDYMKEKCLITLTKEQKEIAIKKGEIDKMLGKAQCVKFVFERMANLGKKFEEVLNGQIR